MKTSAGVTGARGNMFPSFYPLFVSHHTASFNSCSLSHSTPIFLVKHLDLVVTKTRSSSLHCYVRSTSNAATHVRVLIFIYSSSTSHANATNIRHIVTSFLSLMIFVQILSKNKQKRNKSNLIFL